MSPVTVFLAGSIAAQCFVISLFFLRYAKKTGDSFFRYFTIAFTLLGIERLVWLFVSGASEFRPVIYSFRLAAFFVIIVAILMKNRQAAGE